MKLTDSEILELHDLCNSVVDGTISDAQQAKLAQWLASSLDARQYYIRSLGLSASLCHHAAEMQTGDPADPQGAGTEKVSRRTGWIIGWLAIAASIAVALLVIVPNRDGSHVSGGNTGGGNVASAPTVPITQPTTNENEFVARLTNARDCEWANNDVAVPLGGRLRKGQQIELAKGFAQITFDSGAQVVLQGPASLDVDSAWKATLARGTMKASVPPQAVGFSVSNPTVEVVDLGTEFTMFADASGTAAEVLVLKGEVEAAPRAAPDQQPIVLRENESRRFAASGVSAIADSGQRFGALSQLVLAENLGAPTGYAHWSFDEIAGSYFKADVSRVSVGASGAQMEIVTDDSLAAAQSAGRHHRAVKFDGRLYATAAFPGMSANLPHTVVFWAKVPKDATLSNAYAMVAWGANSEKFGSHPFQICWNRNPSEGIVGALRTDYGRGFAIGATPLRDGRWHHIAVVFMPTTDPNRPIEVRQYVDGRLEGEGTPDKPGSDIFMKSKYANATSGTIWLGCRVGTTGPRAERFRGEMDELFIADRALQPQEILRLMSDNEL